MTTSTRSLDLTTVVAQYRAVLPRLSDAELEHRAAAVAVLPGRLADELRRLVDAERDSRRRAGSPARSRMLQVAAGTAVAGAPVAVIAGRAASEYADQVPQALVYAPAVAVGLVVAMVGGRWVARRLAGRSEVVVEPVAEEDLDPAALELLARVRAARRARGEVC